MPEKTLLADSAWPVVSEGEKVSRPRLNRRLSAVVSCGAAVVHAGAGYGKTTLLRDWISSVRRELDVLSIGLTSPSENELAERLAADLELPSRDGTILDLPSVVAALGRAAQIRRRPVVLAVDESGVPSPQGCIARLRSVSPNDRPSWWSSWPVARLDVSDWRRVAVDRQPVELDERDLRFDESETRDLLALLGTADVSDDEIERLHRRTRGWAAGLSLAARAGQIGGGAHVDVDAEHDRLVGRYLDDEVLPWLSSDHLGLLEATAILRRLDPRLCDVLLERTDSAALFTDLVKRSCLVEPVSVDPPAFTMHPMLAAHLRARRRASDAASESKIRTRAMDWYEEAGLTDAAIELALDDPRPERSVALIKAVCGDRIRFGRAGLVVDWLERLPSDVLSNDVELLIVMGRAAGLIGDPTTGRAVLQTVGGLGGGDEVSAGLGLALAQLDTSVRFWEGRLEGLGRAIEERRAEFDLCLTDPLLDMAQVDAESLHVSLAIVFAVGGALDRAIDECEFLLRPDRMLDPTRLTIAGFGVLALALAWRGDEAAARETVRRGRRICERYRGGGNDPGFLDVAAVWVGNEGSDLDDAFRVTKRIASGVVHLPGSAVAHLAVAKLRLRLAAPAEATKALAAADDAIAAMPAPGYLAVLRDALRSDLAALDVDTIEPLSDRELEVLHAVARCESRSAAAEELYLSLNTVKTHLRSAYRKLRVTDRDEAIRRCVALGILDADRAETAAHR